MLREGHDVEKNHRVYLQIRLILILNYNKTRKNPPKTVNAERAQMTGDKNNSKNRFIFWV